MTLRSYFLSYFGFLHECVVLAWRAVEHTLPKLICVNQITIIRSNHQDEALTDVDEDQESLGVFMGQFSFSFQAGSKPEKGGCALIAEKGQRGKDYCMAA